MLVQLFMLQLFLFVTCSFCSLKIRLFTYHLDFSLYIKLCCLWQDLTFQTETKCCLKTVQANQTSIALLVDKLKRITIFVSTCTNELTLSNEGSYIGTWLYYSRLKQNYSISFLPVSSLYSYIFYYFWYV